jgi:hypothetical protein
VLLGVFAAVNTLAKQGRLSPEQEQFRSTTNQWFDENMPLPTDSMPDLYSEAHPHVVAWFKRTATVHLAQIPGYLEILESLGVTCQALESDDPGTILYEDDYQVVATVRLEMKLSSH